MRPSSMTPNIMNTSPYPEDSVFPSPPLSPLIRELPKVRKKVVVVVQSNAAPDVISSDISKCSNQLQEKFDLTIAPPKNESPLSPFIIDSGDSSSTSSGSKENIKFRKLRRFVCPVCKKRFIRRGAYSLHQFKQHGLLPLACEEEGCKERFSTLSALFKHRAVHDPNRRYPCPNCGRIFTTFHARRIHSRVHAASTFKCDKCSLNFFRFTALQRHLKLHHPNRRPPVKSTPVILSKEQVARMDASLANLRTIRPKPLMGHLPSKLPLPRQPSTSTLKRAVPSLHQPQHQPRQIQPTVSSNHHHVLKAVPLTAFIPVYCAQSLSAAEPDPVLPHVYTISATGESHTSNDLHGEACQNAFHTRSSVYAQDGEEHNMDGGFPVQLNSPYSAAPVEIVDLDLDSASLPGFIWPNESHTFYQEGATLAASPSINQTWLQPITLFPDHLDNDPVCGNLHVMNEVYSRVHNGRF